MTICRESDSPRAVACLGEAGLHDERAAPCVRSGCGRSVRLSHKALSRRQREVLSLARSGLTSPQIANVLELSPRTVNGYFLAAYERLDAKNRTEAVAKAIDLGEI